MADSSHVEMTAHQQTYASFIKLLKYGAAVCAVTAFLVIMIISH